MKVVIFLASMTAVVCHGWAATIRARLPINVPQARGLAALFEVLKRPIEFYSPEERALYRRELRLRVVGSVALAFALGVLILDSLT
ncbi:MAG: hypothetical protein ACOY5Y_09805 [Pseudomonadota bacterium]